MKNNKCRSFGVPDLFFIVFAIAFSLSCIGTTYHTAKTAEKGQFQGSVGYIQGRTTADFSESPVQLIGVSARYGIARGFDMGTEYTWDVSKGNENAYATVWVDGKVQITNRNNSLMKPILSSGLMKGYIYDPEAKLHVSTLPILLSLPVNDRITPTFTYRFELISEGFLPSSFQDPRHSVFLGLEYAFTDPDPRKWRPTMNFTIGTLNSLDGGSDGSRVLTFNLGVKVNSPYKR